MDNISFETFKTLDIRVAEIKEVYDIEGADKLYRLVIDIGEKREIIAGIKGYYDKESLLGKKIIVIANLEPKVIRGVKSHGMLLAAVTEDKSALSLISLDKDMPPGTRIS